MFIWYVILSQCPFVLNLYLSVLWEKKSLFRQIFNARYILHEIQFAIFAVCFYMQIFYKYILHMPEEGWVYSKFVHIFIYLISSKLIKILEIIEIKTRLNLTITNKDKLYLTSKIYANLYLPITSPSQYSRFEEHFGKLVKGKRF